VNIGIELSPAQRRHLFRAEREAVVGCLECAAAIVGIHRGRQLDFDAAVAPDGCQMQMCTAAHRRIEIATQTAESPGNRELIIH
jgi:hypothetical protein